MPGSGEHLPDSACRRPQPAEGVCRHGGRASQNRPGNRLHVLLRLSGQFLRLFAAVIPPVGFGQLLEVVLSVLRLQRRRHFLHLPEVIERGNIPVRAHRRVSVLELRVQNKGVLILRVDLRQLPFQRPAVVLLHGKILVIVPLGFQLLRPVILQLGQTCGGFRGGEVFRDYIFLLLPVFRRLHIIVVCLLGKGHLPQIRRNIVRRLFGKIDSLPAGDGIEPGKRAPGGRALFPGFLLLLGNPGRKLRLVSFLGSIPQRIYSLLGDFCVGAGISASGIFVHFQELVLNLFPLSCHSSSLKAVPCLQLSVLVCGDVPGRFGLCDVPGHISAVLGKLCCAPVHVSKSDSPCGSAVITMQLCQQFLRSKF